MAEKEVSAEPVETNPPTEDMNPETQVPPSPIFDDSVDAGLAYNGGSKSKRQREEDGGESDEVSKKQKAESSVDDEIIEKNSVPSVSSRVRLGPKEFGSSVEMFDYFYNLLHYWATHLNLNKYEHMVLLELLKKGHEEPDKKIGKGIKGFQVRIHPVWKSKCFFVIKDDDTFDDFSFRKCVDHILPLPDEMKQHDTNKASNGSRGGKGSGRGRGKRR
ncbi:hypothetical protein ERO13_D11G035000v2 [Gossypium hirsutum]|uniref:Protein EMBRYO DEFECTIVE 514 n=4 Tax=Gossypium TaxID=3633 RepID=A0ABM3B319_GOSHI|nr:protein EMBRYO DEFECTIVE 514-like [Gossypium hirsutum]KAG4118721.1 hypothetical protein ERO13_D11G035000v2 [Gossypium hirsutum]TYH42058.1 hypothetical protein ES332_D11G037700v1 [Gossypium tomentosum]TYI53871.1 hypothetical protein E1A91_D11G036800v1 [Gossypium mustelinum]